MYSLRTKNKERFRTQILRETYDETPNPSERGSYIFHSPPAQTQLSQSRQSQVSISILKNLEKHIEYVEKKFNESEAQKEAIKNNYQLLKSQLEQKEAIIERQLIIIRQNQGTKKDLLAKYESLKADVENFKLQQKVEKLNREILEQKEVQRKTQLRYARKKDRFSCAFLPSPFGSPKHISEQPSQIFQNIVKDQLSQSSFVTKNPFEESLWSQWKKLKNQKVKREKDLALQAANVQTLKKELLTQKRQFEQLRMEFERREHKSMTEISKLKGRIITYVKDQKLLMSKLKLNEQKMMELSMSMKQKGQSDGDRFFAHSSALQLQQIFEKISHNLDIDSSTIDLTIEVNNKKERSTQTHADLEETNLKKIQILNAKIKELESQIVKKQKQWVNRLQQSNSSYMSELKDASDMMDLYKCRIQHLSKLISDHEVQKNNETKVKESVSTMMRQVGVSCTIIAEQQHQEEQLSEKMKIMRELNQEQTKKIALLQLMNAQLQHRIEEDQAKQHIDRLRWIQQVKEKYQNDQMEEKQETSCLSCKNWKVLLSKSQLQHLNFVESMQKKIGQNEHFQHSLQDALSKYENLEKETHNEINKLKEQLIEKEKQIQFLAIELQEKNSQLSVEKEQVDQLRKIINKLQSQIEVYQEKIDLSS